MGIGLVLQKIFSELITLTQLNIPLPSVQANHIQGITVFYAFARDGVPMMFGLTFVFV